jgi:hypothetical protein
MLVVIDTTEKISAMSLIPRKFRIPRRICSQLRNGSTTIDGGKNRGFKIS